MENPPLKDQNVNGPRNQDQFIFDLHLAEYEALMTRNSYLLQVQYAFWPVALVILAITAQVWSTDKIGGVY
jgi:hypothetical protein